MVYLFCIHLQARKAIALRLKVLQESGGTVFWGFILGCLVLVADIQKLLDFQ